MDKIYKQTDTMRLITTLLLIATLISVYAQHISRSLDDHKSLAADLVIFAFGSDNPVKIGTLDTNGNFRSDLSQVLLPEMTADTRKMFIAELRNVFYFGCGNSNEFDQHGVVPSVRGGNVALLVNNEWTGSFFLVSDQELKLWLEDPGYNSAVRGLFWDKVYVDADVSINMNCRNEIHLEDDIAEVSYEYNLDLKKGFNWVEYSIEDIHVMDPEIMAYFPSKVRISNLGDQDKMKCMAVYFF